MAWPRNLRHDKLGIRMMCITPTTLFFDWVTTAPHDAAATHSSSEVITVRVRVQWYNEHAWTSHNQDAQQNFLANQRLSWACSLWNEISKHRLGYPPQKKPKNTNKRVGPPCRDLRCWRKLDNWAEIMRCYFSPKNETALVEGEIRKMYVSNFVEKHGRWKGGLQKTSRNRKCSVSLGRSQFGRQIFSLQILWMEQN